MPKKDFNQQLMEYLSSLPADELAAKFAEVVEQDKALKKQWQVRLMLVDGKPASFKKVITKALPKKVLVMPPNLWRKVGIYFADALAVFVLAFAELDRLTTQQQFDWLIQAFEQLNLVIEQIDDSGGYRFELVDELSSRLIACFHQLDWSVEQKAQWLREHQFKYDVFADIPRQFALTDELEKAFDALPTQNEFDCDFDEYDDMPGFEVPSNVSLALLNKLSAKKS